MTSWTERQIGRRLVQLFDHRCIILCPNCKWTGHELDVLGVTHHARIIDIEIKVSRADFLRDRHKDKWFKAYNWREDKPILEPSGRRRYVGKPIEWPERVWKHYYALPASIWQPDMASHISPKSGVLLLSHPSWDKEQREIQVKVHRRAVPDRNADRLKPEAILDIARLCNLRMWSALEKAHEQQQPHARRTD